MKVVNNSRFSDSVVINESNSSGNNNSVYCKYHDIGRVVILFSIKSLIVLYFRISSIGINFKGIEKRF